MAGQRIPPGLRRQAFTRAIPGRSQSPATSSRTPTASCGSALWAGKRASSIRCGWAEGISIGYTNTGVTPLVTGILPSQIFGPWLTNGVAVFTFGTVSNRSYAVEWTTDLSSHNWQVWTNLTGCGVKAQLNVPLS